MPALPANLAGIASMKKAILMPGLVAMLAACAPGASVTTASDAAAGSFAPKAGAGTIYVIRGLDAVVLAGAPVHLDGQPVGSLRRYDYVRLDVAPGQHRITCGTDGVQHIVDVQPGQMAFVEVLLHVGLMAPRCALRALDELNGRARVTEGRRVGPPT
jgi:hypothetical protein